MALTVIDSLRNIAIVAHVDHGKTTLIDALLRQANVFRENQSVAECILDSNDLERERGITILAKNTSIRFGETKINIIDTPGHADFGGEVERVLQMADGVLLLVDAFEGPMPQTRFVLQKALSAGLKPVVVINKLDRGDARPDEVLDEVFDLFVELGASDEQLDFPHLYASGRDGYAKRELADPNADCRPLLETVVAAVPPPRVDRDGPFQLQVAAIDYSEYVGRIAIGRVHRGRVAAKMNVSVSKRDGARQAGRIEALHAFEALERVPIAEAGAGEIVCLTGLDDVDLYDTVTDPECPEVLPAVEIDEPTLTMEFRVNDSPFAGQEGQYVTSRHLGARLERELRSNVALRVESTDSQDAFAVSGRGLLHLGILIENMRREGYEFAVGKPRVILRRLDGKLHEPVEVLTVDVPEPLSGKVLEIVGTRKAALEKMEVRGQRQHLSFRIPSRGLIGLRSRLLNATRGEAVMYHVFAAYEPFCGEIPRRPNGVLISKDLGEATPYAIDALQQRGAFFVRPQARVYPGMVVGENNRLEDLCVNVCKGKKLTNVRAAGSDRNLVLAPPREFSLEAALEYIEDDELVEVTPASMRLRKRLLDENARKRQQRAAL